MKYTVTEHTDHWVDIAFQFSSAELMMRQKQLELRLKPRPAPEELKTLVQQTCMREAVQTFLKKEALKVWGSPSFQLESQPGETGFSFTSRLALLPEIKLPDYSHLQLEVPPVAPPTEEAAQMEMFRLRYQLSDPIEVTRPVRWGDLVELGWLAFDASGQPIPLSARARQNVIVNGALFYPGFMEGLIGKSPGERFQIQIQAPADYFHPPARNQPVTYQGQVYQVFEPRHAKTDVELLQRLGEVADMPALYAQIVRDVLLQNQKEWQQGLRRALVQLVSEHVDLELTEAVVLAELRADWERQELPALLELGYDAQVQEASWLAWQRSPELRERAFYKLKDSLVLYQIAAKEQLAATPEEVMAVVMGITDAIPGSPSPEDIFFEMRRNQQLEPLLAQLEAEKVIDFLMARLTLICEGQVLLSPEQP